MTFDARQDNSVDAYMRFVLDLKVQTAREIAEAQSEPQITQAIEAFLQKAYSAHLAADELTDFFCVDADSIIDRLGLSEDREELLVGLFDELHDAHLQARRKTNGSNRDSR